MRTGVVLALAVLAESQTRCACWVSSPLSTSARAAPFFQQVGLRQTLSVRTAFIYSHARSFAFQALDGRAARRGAGFRRFSVAPESSAAASSPEGMDDWLQAQGVTYGSVRVSEATTLAGVRQRRYIFVMLRERWQPPRHHQSQTRAKPCRCSVGR